MKGDKAMKLIQTISIVAIVKMVGIIFISHFTQSGEEKRQERIADLEKQRDNLDKEIDALETWKYISMVKKRRLYERFFI
jgi:hypothetical protein